MREPCIECGRPIEVHCQKCGECQPTPGLSANDLRSSALLTFLTYTETKRRLRPTRPIEDAGFFDALDEVRRYVTDLIAEPCPRCHMVVADGEHWVPNGGGWSCEPERVVAS